MRTIRQASMGYGGCKHASIQYPGSGFTTYRRRRGYQCRRKTADNRNMQRMMVMFMIFIAITVAVISVTASGSNRIDYQVNNLEYHPDNTKPVSTMTLVAADVIQPMMTRTQELQIETLILEVASSTEPVDDPVDDPPPVEIDAATVLATNLGNPSIEVNGAVLTRYDLPDKYYPGIDFSSFQPYMGYKCITNKSSPAYSITRSDRAYNDEYGMRRYQTTNDQFTIDGQDDYVIALGTFYKEKGTAGSRYLIVTTTGMYTAIAGDEKSDSHTDSRHMFSLHQDGSCAGIIEWIVDQENLERSMKRAGTITAGPIVPLQGEILHIYGIN